MPKPIHLLALCLSLLLLVACGPSQKRVTTSPKKPAAAPVETPVGPDWDALAARVANREDGEKALALARKANETLKAGNKEAALEQFYEAGDLIDLLQERVEKVDERLWNRGEFKSLQRQWEPLAKPFKRANFR